MCVCVCILNPYYIHMYIYIVHTYYLFSYIYIISLLLDSFVVGEMYIYIYNYSNKSSINQNKKEHRVGKIVSNIYSHVGIIILIS